MTTFLSKYERLTDIRATDPGAIRRAADARAKAPLVPADCRRMIIAWDHPARRADATVERDRDRRNVARGGGRVESRAPEQ